MSDGRMITLTAFDRQPTEAIEIELNDSMIEHESPAERNGTRRRGPRSALASPTMSDVARIAHVSSMTVSACSTTTRPSGRRHASVLAAIVKLDYRRNLAARALVTRHSQTIGIVAFDATLYGQAASVAGVEQAARNAGYFVSIAIVKNIDAALDPRGRRLARRTVGRGARRRCPSCLVAPGAEGPQDGRTHGGGERIVSERVANGGSRPGRGRSARNRASAAPWAPHRLACRGSQ